MSDYFDRVERQIVRRVETGVPRSARMPTAFAHFGRAAAVLVVIVVAGVFLLARGGHTARQSAAPQSDLLTVSFTPAAINPRLPVASVIGQTIHVLRKRFAAAGLNARVQRVAGDQIVVRAPSGTSQTGAQILALSGVGSFEVYDWEADVITPNGKTVASQLAAQDPTAIEISQGSGSLAPGQAGAGSISLAQALRLATKLPHSRNPAAPVEYFGGNQLNLPPGYVALQATGGGDQFFILQARPALTLYDISSARPGTDPNTHTAQVQIALTKSGQRALHTLTAAVARRGALVSSPGQTFDQHFAVAIDNKLITVPYVDYKQYPDGLIADDEANLIGGFTTQSAKDTAILLRYGPLPLNLTAAG
jgi:preprotein translocase subunit SecD